MTTKPPAQALLLSTSKTSDPLTQVQLHPLVILTISDYITRHVARQQTGPIAGAVIGSQNARDITMEHAFECKLVERDDGIWIMDEEWFIERLQQCTQLPPALRLPTYSNHSLCQTRMSTKQIL